MNNMFRTLKKKKKSRKSLAINEPMPSSTEIRRRLEDVMDSLGLSGDDRTRLLEKPLTEQWQLIQSHKSINEKKPDGRMEGEDVSLQARMENLQKSLEDDLESFVVASIKHLESLAVALRSNPISYLREFVEMKGLTLLLDVLVSMKQDELHIPQHHQVMKCFAAIMNNPTGLKSIISHSSSIKILARSLLSRDQYIRTTVLQLLGAVSLIPDGHKKVREAFEALRGFAGELSSYQTVVMEVARKTDNLANDANNKMKALALINAIICGGPGLTSRTFRMHIRQQLESMGLRQIIGQLKQINHAQLHRHIQIYEDVALDDEDAVGDSLRLSEEETVDLQNIASMSSALEKSMKNRAGYRFLLSMFAHLLMLRSNESRTTVDYKFRLLDEVTKFVVMQEETQATVNVTNFDFSIKDVVSHYISSDRVEDAEREMRLAQTKADEADDKRRMAEDLAQKTVADFNGFKQQHALKVNKLKKDLIKERSNTETYAQKAQVENQELVEQLQAKEIECDSLQKEVETLKQTIEELKASIASKKNFEKKLNIIQRSSSDNLLKESGEADAMSSTSASTVTTTIVDEEKASLPPPPPLPPPTNESGLPPPPPPPAPPPPMFGAAGLDTKDTPESSIQLKSLNWQKIPKNKLEGSVFEDMDEMDMYDLINLEEFESLFSAYQHKQGGGIYKVTDEKKNKEISVIDSRRAQNCSILLNRLKLNNREIHHAIMTMDANDTIDTDMVEIMLKYVPTEEEASILKPFEEKAYLFAPADRFIWEMSKIPRYENRLSVLAYIRKFQERVEGLRPQIDDVCVASQQVLESKGLVQFLKLTLAVGNYMNKGQRANVFGFKVDGLLKIADTRSGKRREYNLLHYLVELMDSVPGLISSMELKSELSHVFSASKVNLQQLTADVNFLGNGLLQMQRELEWHRNSENELEEDCFVDVVEDYEDTIRPVVHEVRSSFTTMEKLFHNTLKQFAWDKEVQADIFFKLFSDFMQQVDKARDEIHAIKEREEQLKRKQREEEEEKNRIAQLIEEGKVERDTVSSNANLDDLVSVLAQGDILTKHLPTSSRTSRGDNNGPIKRRRRRTTTSSSLMQ
eukprot:m.72494 g.72494  ORF g.72494 m.72494 type:complete len:1089 (+) comp11740_c0_seq1:183-3449(+)